MYDLSNDVTKARVTRWRPWCTVHRCWLSSLPDKWCVLDLSSSYYSSFICYSSITSRAHHNSVSIPQWESCGVVLTWKATAAVWRRERPSWDRAAGKSPRHTWQQAGWAGGRWISAPYAGAHSVCSGEGDRQTVIPNIYTFYLIIYAVVCSACSLKRHHQTFILSSKKSLTSYGEWRLVCLGLTDQSPYKTVLPTRRYNGAPQVNYQFIYIT